MVGVLALADKGVVSALKPGADPLPPIGLFIKPLRGAGGREATAWKYLPDGTWRSNAGEILDAAGLTQRLEKLSAERPYIVRELATNHRDIADLTAGALSTVRVVTCLDENGRPEVRDAHLKMSVRKDVVVDNYHAGGIAARVDMATGRLEAAVTGNGRWQTHPGTGGQIAGRSLPMWENVIDVALRAHAAFPDHVAIGWDIAILDDGAKLVEGNKSPGIDSTQVSFGDPAGSSRLGELIALHLERAVNGLAA